MSKAVGVIFERLCVACLLDSLDIREGMRVFSTEFGVVCGFRAFMKFRSGSFEGFMHDMEFSREEGSSLSRIFRIYFVKGRV